MNASAWQRERERETEEILSHWEGLGVLHIKRRRRRISCWLSLKFTKDNEKEVHSRGCSSRAKNWLDYEDCSVTLRISSSPKRTSRDWEGRCIHGETYLVRIDRWYLSISKRDKRWLAPDWTHPWESVVSLDCRPTVKHWTWCVTRLAGDSDGTIGWSVRSDLLLPRSRHSARVESASKESAESRRWTRREGDVRSSDSRRARSRQEELRSARGQRRTSSWSCWSDGSRSVRWTRALSRRPRRILVRAGSPPRSSSRRHCPEGNCWWERERTAVAEWDIERASCSCTLTAESSWQRSAVDCTGRAEEGPRKEVDRLLLRTARGKAFPRRSAALCSPRSSWAAPDRIRRTLHSIRHRQICSGKQPAELSRLVSAATTTTRKTNETRDGGKEGHWHGWERTTEEEGQGSREASLLCSRSKERQAELDVSHWRTTTTTTEESETNVKRQSDSFPADVLSLDDDDERQWRKVPRSVHCEKDSLDSEDRSRERKNFRRSKRKEKRIR